MRKLCKQLLVLTALLCCLAGMALQAQAAEIVDSGTCGYNLTWTLDSEGNRQYYKNPVCAGIGVPAWVSVPL